MNYRNAHIAIIMDGNGRWAQARGLPRSAGHRAGAKAAQRIIEAAAECDIGTLSLYAFSSDNWSRPTSEVRNLMTLLRRYLATETARCRKNNIRLSIIGRRDRLAPALVRVIENAEAQTQACSGLHLRLAVDYSSTHAIATAAAQFTDAPDRVAAFSRSLCQAIHSPKNSAPVDLLIRTGGELRLSDFLLWECAYAELCFLPVLWPDFEADELHAALSDYAIRDRRFVGVTLPNAATG